jgi:outer membrane biosynthesis protein TonB
MTIRPFLLALFAISALAQSAMAEDNPTGACRRYVPGARTTVAVACDEAPPVQVAATERLPQPAVPAVVKPEPAAAELPTERAAPVAVQPSSAPQVAQPQPLTNDAQKRGDRKICVEILDRAQRGDVRDGDIQTLRQTCQKAS